MPENNRDYGNLSLEESYADFYFGEYPIDAALSNGGVICLHNSWTPERYKSMDAEEFLRQNTMLSNLLRHLSAPEDSRPA